MKNIWSELENESIKETMRLLGFEEKYIDGEASDFEKFCCWLSAFSLLEGNKTAENFAIRLSDILGKKLSVKELSRAEPCALWNEYNAKRHGTCYLENTVKKQKHVFLKTKEEYCVEKQYNLAEYLDANEFIDGRFPEYSYILSFLENTSDNAMVSRFNECDFVRPNRYLAEMALNKTNSGEKCNFTEINTFLSQIIMELIFAKKCQKIQLHIDATESLSYEYGLIKYLSDRELGARVYVRVTQSHDPEAVRRVCLLSHGELFVTPVLKGDDTSDFTQRLAQIYPIGLLL